jgi:hypothetical protein
MSTSPGRRSLAFASLSIAIVLVTLIFVSCGEGRSTSRPGAPVVGDGIASRPPGLHDNAEVITVGRPATSQSLQAGFLGLSLEFPAIEAYAGSEPHAVNQVLAQLIRNLTPGQSPVLRIGGDSTDWTWWPIAHFPRPAGVNYALDPRWLAVTAELVRALDARVILGIDLEADSRRVAAAEASGVIAGIGGGHVAALEPGNEPELYGSFTWDGSGATGRPHGYDFAAFVTDFAWLARALPPFPIAGPATGGPRWIGHLSSFLAAESSVRIVTLHRYPLQQCFVPPRESDYPTIGNLLSDRASRDLANSIAPSVEIAHAHRLPLRIDEMNTNSCGGDTGVSKSFASALWILDVLFQMARVGVDGVNIHSYPGATYELFTFTRVHGSWQAFVEPEYYGMLMFAQAAPPGSRLLRVSLAQPGGGLKAWATRAPDGQTRVVLINESAHARIVAVRAPIVTGDSTLVRLQAPSIRAERGVTLGGQSFGSHTQSGQLDGRELAASVTPTGGEYVVTLTPASAALLRLPKP